MDLIQKICKEEPREVLAGLLLDLCGLDKKNKERIEILYLKR